MPGVQLKEALMSLDKIVICILALAFFGGLAFLSWKTRRDAKRGGQVPSSAIPEGAERDASNRSKEKERRISKS
jgi:hypothetical protein